MDNQVQSAADQETQDKAAAMGWIPPERYKGAPDKFVDADAYIERGETVLPIVKQQLAKERETTAELNRRLQAVEKAAEASRKALEEIELKNSVATQKAIEAAKKEVREELEAAMTAGDHKAAAELTGELAKLESAPPPPEKKEVKTEAPPKVEIDQEQKEWNEANPWFGTDRRKTALALAVAQELRESGDKRTGKAFLNSVKAEVEKTFGGAPNPDKVGGGGRNGSDAEDTSSSSSSSKKGYNSLPADAKAACDADARQFVGPNKKYKDIASWRQAYADVYHAN